MTLKNYSKVADNKSGRKQPKKLDLDEKKSSPISTKLDKTPPYKAEKMIQPVNNVSSIFIYCIFVFILLF
jgi:hypothetical protein